MNWTALGVIVGVLSFILNVVQFIQNRKLKGKLVDMSQKIEKGGTGYQQTHAGTGDNIAFGGNGTMNK